MLSLLAIVAVERPDARRTPALGEADRIRLAEAFRLADSLGDAGRSAFYPVGAAEGLLLDRVDSAWRSQYSGAGFTLDGLFDGRQWRRERDSAGHPAMPRG